MKENKWRIENITCNLTSYNIAQISDFDWRVGDRLETIILVLTTQGQTYNSGKNLQNEFST